jgi:hypothetical protein
MGGGDVRIDRHRRLDRRAGGPLFCECEPQGAGSVKQPDHRQPNRLHEPHAQRDAFQDSIAVSGQEPDSVSDQEPDPVSDQEPDDDAGHEPDPVTEPLPLTGR